MWSIAREDEVQANKRGENFGLPLFGKDKMVKRCVFVWDRESSYPLYFLSTSFVVSMRNRCSQLDTVSSPSTPYQCQLPQLPARHRLTHARLMWMRLPLSPAFCERLTVRLPLRLRAAYPVLESTLDLIRCDFLLGQFALLCLKCAQSC